MSSSSRLIFCKFGLLLLAGLCLGKNDVTLSERANFQHACLFRFSRFSPWGADLRRDFGAQPMLGIEQRIISKYGVGGAISADLSWAVQDTNISTILSIAADARYGYRLFSGTLMPYAGMALAYNSIRLYSPEGDTHLLRAGSGMTFGPFLGCEFPLYDRVRLALETRFNFGGAATSYYGRRNRLEGDAGAIAISNAQLTLALSIGLTDVCFW